METPNLTMNAVLGLLGNTARSWVRDAVRDALGGEPVERPDDHALRAAIRDDVSTQVEATLDKRFTLLFDSLRNREAPDLEKMSEYLETVVEQCVERAFNGIDWEDFAQSIAGHIRVDASKIEVEADEIASHIDTADIGRHVARNTDTDMDANMELIATQIVRTIARKLSSHA